ncbi:Zinc transporter 1like, partial [Caligus rogercresseyi]
MMHSVWPLLIESAMILLQPLKRKLLSEVEGILEIHDFHIWQLAGNRIIASAHIRCLNLSEYMRLRKRAFTPRPSNPSSLTETTPGT